MHLATKTRHEKEKKFRKPAMFAVTQKDDQENGATLDIAVMSVM